VTRSSCRSIFILHSRPTLQLGLRDELKGPWTGEYDARPSSSKLKRHESGTDFDAGSVTAVALTLGLRRDLATNIAHGLGIGGSGLLGQRPRCVSTGWRRDPASHLARDDLCAVLRGARHGIEFALQYDVHRFLTPALRSVGFNRRVRCIASRFR